MKHRQSPRRLLMFLPVCFAVCACSSWRLWPWKVPEHRSSEQSDAAVGIGPYPTSAARDHGTQTEGILIVDLAFDVLRADIPLGDVRHSQKIWNHVDELRTDPELTALLLRNGLRVGAGSSGSWSAIQTVLDAADAQLRKDQFAVQRGMPLVIELASIREPQAVFSYGRNNRLAGKTFPTGDKLLNLDYAFHPRLGGCTELQIGFEIRHDRGVMTWERQDDIIRQVPAYNRYPFDELRVLLTLKPGEFLVVGTSGDTDNEYLIGNRFLTVERQGKQFESILCITPRPYRTRGTQRRSS